MSVAPHDLLASLVRQRMCPRASHCSHQQRLVASHARPHITGVVRFSSHSLHCTTPIQTRMTKTKEKSPVPTASTLGNSDRPLRRLPKAWKKTAYPPPSIPTNYPDLLALSSVRQLVEGIVLDGVIRGVASLSAVPTSSSPSSPPSSAPDLPGDRPNPLAIALRSPAVTKLCVPRSTNAHLLLAQRGDSIIRTILLNVGEELGLTLSGRHVRCPVLCVSHLSFGLGSRCSHTAPRRAGRE